VTDDDACGARPLRGLMHAVAHRQLSIEELDRRNSGDTAGDRQRVVGYAAFAVV
jgi:AmmeMemoRadiSam system protein B